MSFIPLAARKCPLNQNPLVNGLPGLLLSTNSSIALRQPASPLSLVGNHFHHPSAALVSLGARPLRTSKLRNDWNCMQLQRISTNTILALQPLNLSPRYSPFVYFLRTFFLLLDFSARPPKQSPAEIVFLFLLVSPCLVLLCLINSLPAARAKMVAGQDAALQ